MNFAGGWRIFSPRSDPGDEQTQEEDGARSGKQKSLGTIDYKLDYNFNKNELCVTVLQCLNLPAMDLGGTSDPYVKLYLMPAKKKKFETKKHKKTLNPVFNEQFNFKIPYTEVGSNTLMFDIYDYDAFGSDDLIGQVSIPLSRIDLCQESEETATIEAPKKDHLGEICFSLRYVPQKSQLTVVILECKNLKKMDIGGLSDPYVKIAILQQGKRIKKSKTTIKMHTLNPYYNESFKFDVAPMLMSKIQLCLTVVDYDRVGSNDIIGKVTLGHGVGGNAQKHFTEVIEKPRRSIAQWHTLQPIEDKK